MMNQKALWWTVGAVAVVAIVVGVAVSGTKGPESSVDGTADEQAVTGTVQGGSTGTTGVAGAKPTSASATSTESISFADLMNRGGNQQCTVNHETAAGTTTGTVYIAGKNVRADYSTVAPIIGKVETHTIVDGTNVYAWSSIAPNGYRFPIMVAMRSGAADEGKRDGSISSFGDKMDFKCMSWKPDSAKFSLPASVTFTEYKASQP